MKFFAYSLSDTGSCRENNEDSFLIADKGDEHGGQLYAVADGMGGYLAGETASRIVCQRLEELYFKEMTRFPEKSEAVEKEILFLLEKIAYKIHREIFQLASDDPKLSGMGSTLSLLLLRKDRALICHVGDSRIYRWRDGRLAQLTEDQTEVQRYVKMGRLSQKEAQSHHLSHILSQAIGGRKDSFRRAATDAFPVELGDRFLLCSDGLYDMVADESIAKILCGSAGGGDVCRQLLQKALQRGGKDNITVLLVQERESRLQRCTAWLRLKSFVGRTKRSDRKDSGNGITMFKY